MNIRFHRQALREFVAAIQYLDEQAEGTGEELRIAVDAAIGTIVSSPTRWPVYRGSVRRYCLRRFRYCVFYQMKDEEIVIIAIMHTSRRPDYWRNRLSED